jgi:hypothetical protein
MKDYGPFPQPGVDLLVDLTMGRALLAIGDAPSAVTRLKAASSSCGQGALRVTAYTQSFGTLGDALAALGNVASACDAYGTVVRHWGSLATSQTAKRARRARADLGCAALE